VRKGYYLALGACDVILAALLAWDVMSEPPPARVPGSVLPELAAAHVVELAIAREGERAVLRFGQGPPRLIEPVQAPADPAAVQSLLGALELLAGRRQLDGRDSREGELGLTHPRALLSLRLDSGAEITLELGAEVAAAGGAWIRRRDTDTVVLVEANDVRDLDRRADDLRRRHPFTLHRVADAEIAIAPAPAQLGGRLLLRGAPVALVLPTGNARADGSVMSDLGQILDEIELLRFADPPAPSHLPMTENCGWAPAEAFGAPSSQGVVPPIANLVIAVRAGELEECLRVLGPCIGNAERRLVQSGIGTGCASAAALDRVATLARRGIDLVDHHLVTGEVERVLLNGPRGKSSLDVGGPEGVEVRAWLAEVDTLPSGELVALEKLGLSIGTITLNKAHESEQLLLYRRAAGQGAFAIRRGSEGFAFAVPADAPLRLFPPAVRFVSRRLIAREMYDLRVVSRRAGARLERAERGELLTEWRLAEPAKATILPGALERLRDAVASLTALRAVAPQAAAAHGLADPVVVEFIFDPPPTGAAPDQIVLELGARTASGCYARISGKPMVFELGRATCDVLLEPWHK
jgi:hypothetical protein